MNRPLSRAEAQANFPTLNKVVAAYISMDWPDDYASVEDAVAEFVRFEPESVADAVYELDDLIGRGYSEDELQHVLRSLLSIEYAAPADGRTYREWLEELAAGLRDGRYLTRSAGGD